MTRVGPGTPAGELLRRYWIPISVAAELTPEQPTKLVRVLGENLVLFRDSTGRVGLLADRCTHRGASLFYGRVEDRVIRADLINASLTAAVGTALIQPAVGERHVTLVDITFQGLELQRARGSPQAGHRDRLQPLRRALRLRRRHWRVLP